MAPTLRPAGPRPAWSTVRVGSRRSELLTLGAGTPVLFLHGWGVTPRSYRQPLAALARHGFAITAPTLPGFGGSDPLPLRRQNVDGVATHVARLLDQRGGRFPVDVVAHSFGGGVAMRLAATRPDLVGSLTLVCPVGGAGEGPVPLVKMVGGVLLDARHRWAARAACDLATAVARNPLATAATAYAAWQSDQVADLEQISGHRIPVRFLFADKDDVVTPGGIPRCAFAAVTCEVVAGRHSWLITDPARFAAQVAAHLRPEVGRAA